MGWLEDMHLCLLPEHFCRTLDALACRICESTPRQGSRQRPIQRLDAVRPGADALQETVSPVAPAQTRRVPVGLRIAGSIEYPAILIDIEHNR